MKPITLAFVLAFLSVNALNSMLNYRDIRKIKEQIEGIPKERHTVVVQSISTNDDGIILGSVSTTDMDTIKGATAWDRDEQREAYKKALETENWIAEFNRTNTNPNLHTLRHVNFASPVTGSKGQLELGYRPDGVVVWRVLPESIKDSVVIGYRVNPLDITPWPVVITNVNAIGRLVGASVTNTTNVQLYGVDLKEGK